MPLPHYRDHAIGSNDIEDVELWVEVTRQSTRGLAEALLRSGKADNVSSQIFCRHCDGIERIIIAMMMTTMMMDDDDDSESDKDGADVDDNNDDDNDASYWFCRYIITSLQTTSSLVGMKGKSLTHWIGHCQSIIEMYIYLSILLLSLACLFLINLFIYLNIHLFIFISIINSSIYIYHQSIYSSIFLSIHLSIHLSIFLSVYL